MEEFSDRHFEALQYLVKANNDLSLAIQNTVNKKFHEAYGYTSRVRESIRLILEVDKSLSSEDKDQ